MIQTYTLEGETWIDIDHGTPEEIHSIMDKYGIHPFVAKELTSTTPNLRIEFHDTYIYCILHFPVWKHTHSEGSRQEVDFIIGTDFLITARYDTIDAIHKLGKNLEVREVLEKENHHKKVHSHVLFVSLLRELYASTFEELCYMENVQGTITEKIFLGREKEMVVAISQMTRTLLDFKRIIDMHSEILSALSKQGGEILGETFAREMDTIVVEYEKINKTIISNLEIMRELRNTNNSLLHAKQNETIKLLTVIGSILLVLDILTKIFF